MLDVLKVRIYPNKEQEVALAKNFGCSRFVFNYYLNKTNTQYQKTRKGLTYCQMAKDLTQLKKLSGYEWLQEPTAAVLQQSLKNLESAFKNFFAKRVRFPKFKGKRGKQSIRYPESCSIQKGGLKLPKLGIVKASLSKEISGKIKSVTVSKTSTGKYFAAILFETDDLTISKQGKISGIDLGCGFKNDSLNLSIREWICSSCNASHDRDENAAKNLRTEGLKILALSKVEGLSANTVGHTEIKACGESVRLVGTSTKKRVSEKQESPVTAQA